MSNGNGTRKEKAPAWSADACWNAIEDALLMGSIDAKAALQRLLSSGKPPVRETTKTRLRNQHRKVVEFDRALDAVAELRKLSQVVPAAEESAAAAKPAQMTLPLPANSNSSKGATHRIVS